MKELPNVTLVIVDCLNYGEAIMALKKSLEQIKPHSAIFFTDKTFNDPDFEQIMIAPIKSKEDYSKFIIKELWHYITTTHVLIIQNDGYVLDGSVWTDEFLNYDYIGAPWFYKDGRNVGNGGFSLRSQRLMFLIGNDTSVVNTIHPEDEVICRLYRTFLESKKCLFAPEELAHQFAYECHEPLQPTFGFHGNFHPPFQESVVLKRSAAMGDIIMMEPVMEYYHKAGYRVVLDIPPQFYWVFQHHYFPVYHLSQVKLINPMVINLDMAYEINPKQLVLKSYYDVCGIKDGPIRNSKLNHWVDDSSKLFQKYIVMHIDDTAMEHRNVHGVNWNIVAIFLETKGYTVFQIGTGKHRGGIKFNTPATMLSYAIAGADYFIGIDSGNAHIAVGLGIESFIISGSVDLKNRYADFSKIHVIQKACPIGNDGCYHSVVGVSGVDCAVDKKTPPCITFTTEEIIAKLNEVIK
ncbi:MAG TPA: DUF5672 family protein [Cyclobacteriaceae bacterium]|jgi:ADP-heptose:LPS heptosyltransferase|nr:DUF5672 family protein [Cyclobacteriaceae bacterium]